MRSTCTRLATGQIILPMTSVSSASNSPLVLCVDDELVGLQVRRILLERAGYRVVTASSGPEGLEVFRAQPVEAVVLDYSMPGMHGAEVAAHMKQVKPEVPILLLSAHLGLSDETIAHVNLYMTKGEGAPVLLKKLESMLSVAPSAEFT